MIVRAGSKAYHRKWYAFLIITALLLILCGATFISTIAICRARVDHADLSMHMPIPDFIGQTDYPTDDLIHQAEQTVDNHFGLLIEGKRGAWNKGTYHCGKDACVLQHLTLEIAIRTIFPCWIDESGTTIGFTDFNFDITQNRVTADTGFFDRPVMQDAGVRLSRVYPTMDEAVSSSVLPVLEQSTNGEDVVADVYAERSSWKIRVRDLSGTELFVVDVPFVATS